MWINNDKQNVKQLLRPHTDDLRGVNLPDIQVAFDDKDPMVWFGMMYDKKDRQRTARDLIKSTLWLFNIAIGNGPFIDGVPIKNGDFPWLC